MLMVIDFTLVNDTFGRNISNIFLSGRAEITRYFSHKTNIIPFATVKLFINAYKNESLDTLVVLENIFGNFFAFMPFAFFAPITIKNINSARRFLVFIAICVLCVETLQIIFLTGSADIDDFILNVGGAMAAYGILNVKKIKNGINKFMFGERYDT